MLQHVWLAATVTLSLIGVGWLTYVCSGSNRHLAAALALAACSAWLFGSIWMISGLLVTLQK